MLEWCLGAWLHSFFDLRRCGVVWVTQRVWHAFVTIFGNVNWWHDFSVKYCGIMWTHALKCLSCQLLERCADGGVSVCAQLQQLWAVTVICIGCQPSHSYPQYTPTNTLLIASHGLHLFKALALKAAAAGWCLIPILFTLNILQLHLAAPGKILWSVIQLFT